MKYVLIFFSIGILSYSCSPKKETTNTGETPEYSIAYNVLLDLDSENYDVFTMDLDGANKKNVNSLPGVEWTYDSFEDRLYFVSDQDTCKRCYFLYSSDYLGQEVKKISDTRLMDSWMGFNQKGEIVITPHPSIDSVLHIIDTSGTLITRLETGMAKAADPIFVNEGKQVAFKGGTKKSKKDEGYQEEIYTINVDGSDLKKLTNYPKSDTTAAWYAYKAGPPKLHPTENFISYASFQNGKYSLYAVTLDGRKQWKLTDNEFAEVFHDWSPDGNWLVSDLSDEKEEQYNIGLMNWKNKEWKILTDSSYAYQQAPNFVLKKI